MTGRTQFIGRVVAASIGLLGAVTAEAAVHASMAYDGPVTGGRWTDPVQSPVRPRADVRELEMRMEILDDISARLDGVLEQLGGLGEELVRVFATSYPEQAYAAMKSTVDDFRRDQNRYVVERPTNDVNGGDGSVTLDDAVETARLFVISQESVLFAFKSSIQDIYGLGNDPEHLEDAMSRLSTALEAWRALGSDAPHPQTAIRNTR